MHLTERRRLVYSPLQFRPEDWLRFVQLSTFSRKWGKLGLTDDDLRALEVVIMTGPSRPAVMRDSGGLRKIRFADESSGRGKSGAFRICYVYFAEYSVVVLITIFDKSEQCNLSVADRRGIASVIREIESDLAQER
jgi:hypothetical protein